MLDKFLRDESGATATEYGLIAMIITLAVLAGGGGIKGYIESSYQNTMTKLQEATEYHAE